VGRGGWNVKVLFFCKFDKIPILLYQVNSIQLMNDGERWWVVSIYWLGETERMPLPKNYLPKK